MDFLQEQRLPVAIGGERFDVKAAFCKVVFMQVLGKTAAQGAHQSAWVEAELAGEEPVELD